MTIDLLGELALPQRLALTYAPRGARVPQLALLALDARLAMIVRKRHEVVLAQMRIAWWRDMLSLPPAAWPRGDAVLELLRGWRDPAALAPLADGWEALLGEMLERPAIDEFAHGREAGWRAVAAELGCTDPEPAGRAARVWALADLAANLGDAEERALVAAIAGADALPRLPRALRPLTVLAGLGRSALARGAGEPLLEGPTGMLRALRLGLAGR